jgi:hypothetical protein
VGRVGQPQSVELHALVADVAEDDVLVVRVVEPRRVVHDLVDHELPAKWGPAVADARVDEGGPGVAARVEQVGPVPPAVVEVVVQQFDAGVAEQGEIAAHVVVGRRVRPFTDPDPDPLARRNDRTCRQVVLGL